VTVKIARAALLCLAIVSLGGLVIAADTSLSGHLAYLYEALDSRWLDTSRAVGLLQDPYPEARALAAQVLACNPDPSRVRLLRGYLNDVHPSVRYTAVIAAGRLGPAGVDLALDGLDDQTPLVRQAAAWAAAHGGPKAFEALTHLLLTERHQAVRETALGNMWRLGDLAWEPHVARYADHEDPILRRAAAFSLARSHSELRRAALINLCEDDEPVIRATALSGLAVGPVARAEQGLVAQGLSDADWRVRVAACNVLAARPEFEVADSEARELEKLWTDRRAQLAVAAIAAGASHPSVGADATLRGVVLDDEPWPASAALTALARRSPGAVAETITAWLGKGEIWRRRAAARAAVHLPPEQLAKAEPAIVGDPDPGVRLAWLESLDLDGSPRAGDRVWSVVDHDPDPAVRAEAVGLLQRAGRIGDVQRMLDLYDRWLGDEVADARGAALAAALAVGGEDLPQRLLKIAEQDPDPVVAALVVAEGRSLGLPMVTPRREPRHGATWYHDLHAWSTAEHWLDVVTVRGTFRIHLTSSEAPITAWEIWMLAREGFYDGLDFHRVVPNFVVQGGDPRGDGWGGPGFSLPDEITMRPFDSWRVGVATAGPNTGGSQFFITTLPADHLTGHYTNFGEVTVGREVLGRLQAGDRIVRVEASEGDEPKPPVPVLLGYVTWDDLKDLPGWEAGRSGYRPDAASLDRLRSVEDTYTVLSVLGTWCGDSAREIPRLQRVIEEIGTDGFQHVMVAVDRTKRIRDPDFPSRLIGGNRVDRVPTIIVLDGGGHEVGRIVETAERPLEQMLAEMVAAGEGWQ